MLTEKHPILKALELEGSTFELSLTKLLGQKIVDIGGYLSREFDSPVFKITALILEDGTRLGVEGEHDMPYIPDNKKVKGLEEEWLVQVYKLENPDDDF